MSIRGFSEMIQCLNRRGNHCLTPTRTLLSKPKAKQDKQKIASADEEAEKLEPSCAVGGNVKCCSCWETARWRFLEILK